MCVVVFIEIGDTLSLFLIVVNLVSVFFSIFVQCKSTRLTLHDTFK